MGSGVGALARSLEEGGGGWPSDRDHASRAACSSPCSSGSKSCNTSSVVCVGSGADGKDDSAGAPIVLSTSVSLVG